MQQFSTIEIILSGLMLFSFLIQLIYYWGVFARLAFYKEKHISEKNKQPVSVVIAARNDYFHLKENLIAILEQDYPNFEVVVVNHASNDETKELLVELSRKYPRLKPIHFDEDVNFFKGKKFPLSIGIKSAAHKILLLTDADCNPSTDKWIETVAATYVEGTEVVLGYGPYRQEKGLVNKFIRYDTFMVAMQYFSLALAGKPYMGVGRNLSYTKNVFLKNKGFISHYNIASGDDDLFISEVANKANTRIQINPASFVYSKPKKSFGEWAKQKKRHLTTGSEYKFSTKFFLGFFSLSQGLFYATTIAMLLLHFFPWVVIVIFSCRLLTQAIIHKKVLGKLQEKNLFVFSLLLELGYIFLIPFFALTGKPAKVTQWK